MCRSLIVKTVVGLAPLLVLLMMSIVAAQTKGNLPTIGHFSGSNDPTNLGPSFEAFRQGLRGLGYTEGKNILFEHRFAEGDRERISALVNELLQLRVDILLTGNLTAIRAAKRATQKIPIVMVTNADPVAAGLIDSLAQPGGNITGVTNLNRELGGKRLELFLEMLPKASRIAILWDDSNEGSIVGFKEYKAVANALRIKLQSLSIRGSNPDFDGVFQAAVKGRAQGIVPIRNAVILRFQQRIAELAVKHRLSTIGDGSSYADDGGLASYSANNEESYRPISWTES